ncbi:class I SAM-dependent methyltransferase [bacterium]|nr:class I SAM-dependent methyltransferase [bacterium]
MADLPSQTIEDFGEQWTQFSRNEGYFGSVELFRDAFPNLDLSLLAGQRVIDIGSGNGRSAKVLLDLGASHVVAVEPSRAFAVMVDNLASYGDRVTCLHLTGDQVPESLQADMAFSWGVIHHIQEPLPTLKAMRASLRPGGMVAVWLYGREGNELYLSFAQPLRLLTKRLPHWLLVALVRCLDLPLVLYMKLCAILPVLPLARYFNQVLSRLTGPMRRVNVYDQLNPAYAKYYTREEAENLLLDAGFVDIKLHHRHGYSWSVVGRRSDSHG